MKLNIDNASLKAVEPHTLLFSIKLKPNEEKVIQVSPKHNTTEGFEFVMLGDNRDRYELDPVENSNQLEKVYKTMEQINC